jgi:hypothetical protein
LKCACTKHAKRGVFARKKIYSTDVKSDGGSCKVEVLSGHGNGGGGGRTRRRLETGGPRVCGKTQDRLVGEAARVEGVVSELRGPALLTAIGECTRIASAGWRGASGGG